MKNGNLRVQCPSVQSECMQQAELHCAEKGGVHVLSSREKNELFGVEGHQEGTLMSEVIFVCGDDAPRSPIKLPPKQDAVPSKPANPPAKRVCVPGSTQRCIGPGACVGGQSCLPSGVGWAACQCAAATEASPTAGGNADPATGASDPADPEVPATADPPGAPDDADASADAGP